MQLKNLFLLSAIVVVGVSAQAASSGEVQERDNAEVKVEGFKVVRRSIITNTPCHNCIRKCDQRFPTGPTQHHRGQEWKDCWNNCQDTTCKHG